MASSFGMAITNLTSKVGILSRKASVRFATEVGEKILQRKAELGRNLNKEEIEQVYAEIIPKRCRPQVITMEAEARECIKRSGFTDEQIDAQLKSLDTVGMAAANVTNGTKKFKLWIPYDKYAKMPIVIRKYIDTNFPSLMAHETEHALEKNCKPLDIIRRKTSNIRKIFNILFDKNYQEKVNQREIAVHNFEAKLQESLIGAADYDRETGILKMGCKPTIEGISEKVCAEGEGNYVDKIRKIITETFASGSNKGTENLEKARLAAKDGMEIREEIFNAIK